MLQLVTLCLNFADEVLKADVDPDWNEYDARVLRSDRAVVEVIAYSFASINYLLSEHAGLTNVQIAEFDTPLLENIMLPYFRKTVGVSNERSLKNLYKPDEQVVESKDLKKFMSAIRTLTQNKQRSDTDSLVGNLATNLVLEVEEIYQPEDMFWRFSSKVQDGLSKAIEIILIEMDQQIERSLVDFLDRK